MLGAFVKYHQYCWCKSMYAVWHRGLKLEKSSSHKNKFAQQSFY